jgi:hypothetical protein
MFTPPLMYLLKSRFPEKQRWLNFTLQIILILGCCGTSVSLLAEKIGALSYRVDVDHIVITDCDPLTAKVVIPGVIDGKPVTTIESNAFSECQSLTHATIPDSVSSIGKGAFGNCRSLRDIHVTPGNTSYRSHDGVLLSKDAGTLIAYPRGKTASKYVIPESITTIGTRAFWLCHGLTQITILEGVVSIEEEAFSECRRLTQISIPEGLTSIGNWAFSNCNSLMHVSLPNSITSIGRGAFSRCLSLDNISIPNKVTSIGDHAFYECQSLTHITLPENVTSIGDHAFKGCLSLDNIRIPNTVTYIGWDAFVQCLSLTHFTIPESVTSLGFGPFYGCSSLEWIALPTHLKLLVESLLIPANAQILWEGETGIQAIIRFQQLDATDPISPKPSGSPGVMIEVHGPAASHIVILSASSIHGPWKIWKHASIGTQGKILVSGEPDQEMGTRFYRAVATD